VESFRSKRLLRYASFAGVVPLIGFASIVAVVAPPSSGGEVTLCGALPVGSALPDGGRLDADQAANASIIVAVAREADAGTAGTVDALVAAFTESRLANLPGGDRDSVGLFQERPSQGWGTAARILDPVYATDQFLGHLMALPGWQSLPPAAAAQAVERSAFPDRYQQWVQPATELAASATGAGACTNADATSRVATTLPVGFSLPAGTPGPVIAAVSYALAQLGKPYVWGGTGPAGYDCSGLTMEAYGAAGVAIPRTTYDQVYTGQAIYSPDQLAPGDILFTEGSDPGPGGAPGHVGMYVGDGLVVDAPHTGAAVELTGLASWTGQVVAMRRIVPA
jgi:cell wall-associated NlpC family hydrolase